MVKVFKVVKNPENLPESFKVLGNTLSVSTRADGYLEIDVPDNLNLEKMYSLLELAHEVTIKEIKELPGVFKLKKSEEAEISDSIERLLVEQDKALLELRRIPEPTVEINVNDPSLDSMVPIGVKIWDSIFKKHPPVLDLSRWVQTKDADKYVYLPNDASKMAHEAESISSNGMYTEVMVNAYTFMCQQEGIDPMVKLANGAVVHAAYLTPMDGAQHTVPGEVSARLANSTLVELDDSKYASSFLECICSLKPFQFESEPIRRRVLAKAESILMGRTSHTYNQRFIHKLYSQMVLEAMDVPWQEHRVPVANCVMATVKQMVIEGMVLEDSIDIFLSRVSAFGFAGYKEALGLVYASCSVQ